MRRIFWLLLLIAAIGSCWASTQTDVILKRPAERCQQGVGNRAYCCTQNATTTTIKAAADSGGIAGSHDVALGGIDSKFIAAIALTNLFALVLAKF